LDFVPEAGWACLRELFGAAEQEVEGTSTADAVRLLDGLLVEEPGGSIAPGKAITLTATDRDRLLATIYINTFGTRVVNILRCTQCGKPFDVDFSLPELMAFLSPQALESAVERLPDGVFRMADGIRFRLPTGEDECAVLGMPASDAKTALLRRCLVDGESAVPLDGGMKEAVQTVMETLAPILDSDVETQCPECGQVQVAHFDIQHYLLSALHQERSQLAHEIHRLASAYGWSLTEILCLPRHQRKSLVTLIEAERSGRRRILQ
jgi:hypothetical protein